MVERMLYTLFFIFIGIALIGIKVIRDAIRKEKHEKKPE